MGDHHSGIPQRNGSGTSGSHLSLHSCLSHCSPQPWAPKAWPGKEGTSTQPLPHPILLGLGNCFGQTPKQELALAEICLGKKFAPILEFGFCDFWPFSRFLVPFSECSHWMRYCLLATLHCHGGECPEDPRFTLPGLGWLSSER